MGLVKTFEFSTSERAWCRLNQYFLTNAKDIVDRGGFLNGSQLLSFNIFLKIRKAYINPEFDFGKVFDYRKQKWSTLVANYLDLNYLDLVKSEVLLRESKRHANYNVTLMFSNTHKSGHGCLINITFIKRPNYGVPILQFTLRSSDITKRLLFDFLLVQRIGEYVFGPNADFSLEVFLPNAYTTAELACMMDNYYSIEELLSNEDNLNKFSRKVLVTYHKLKDNPMETIKYKVFQRVARGLKGLNKNQLLVKNLSL